MNPAFSAEVIVIGAGAAGLLCAGHTAQRGKRTILLEHQAEIGRKILISGGGRCNFTNLDCGPDNFLSSNPHFAKSALARYTPQDFIALVEKYKIPYHEKKLGQLFCDRSSRDIVRMLEAESKPATIHRKCKIAKIAKAGEFVVETDQGDFRAPVLVIASGGLSIPKIGATAFGYEVAAQFGLKLVRCRPGLVPLTFHEPERKQWCDLAGVAARCVAKVDGQAFEERMLFTHRGLSGPAILQLSSYWKAPRPVCIEFLTTNDESIPKRLAQRLSSHEWTIEPAGTEGYTKAEVTLGGVATEELSSRTMESRRIPGLYFIGEVVDVTGHLGGHNFQWAWSSASAAAESIYKCKSQPEAPS